MHCHGVVLDWPFTCCSYLVPSNNVWAIFQKTARRRKLIHITDIG